jgi:hypothetical protein
MVDYIRQLSGPEIFRASFSIYFSNWRAMISIYFLPVLPALVLESLFEAQKSVGLTLIRERHGLRCERFERGGSERRGGGCCGR